MSTAKLSNIFASIHFESADKANSDKPLNLGTQLDTDSWNLKIPSGVIIKQLR